MHAVTANFDPGLTAPERAMVAAATSGRPAELNGQSVRGHVFRDLVLSLARQDPVLRLGLKVSGGTITGGLDFQEIEARLPLSFVSCNFSCDDDAPAVNLSGAVFSSVSFQFCKFLGAVIADRAMIERDFLCEKVEIDGGGLAFSAEKLHVGGNCEFQRSKFVGQVACCHCNVRGSLSFSDSRIFGSTFGLLAERAVIGEVLDFSNSMVIGLIGLSGGQIGGRLKFGGASLRVDEGVCVSADQIDVGGDVELTSGFATAGGVDFGRARIGGVVDLSGSHVKSAFLCGRGRFVDSGLGVGMEASSKSRLEIARQPLEHTYEKDRLALGFAHARIFRILMPELADNRPCGVVDFSHARVASFHDYAASWPPPYDERVSDDEVDDFDCHVLDGFCYDCLSNPSGKGDRNGMIPNSAGRIGEERVAWLAGQRVRDIQRQFNPQPWTILANRLAEQGYRRDATDVLIAKNRFEAASDTTPMGRRLQSWFLDVFTLYGHSPWRTVFWMAIFVAGFAAIWGWAASQCAVEGCRDQTVFVRTGHGANGNGQPMGAFSDFQPLGYSLDVFVPFANFGFADQWRINTSWRPIGVIPVPRQIRAVTKGGPNGVAGGDRTRNDARVASSGVVVTFGGILHFLMIVEMILGMSLIFLAALVFSGLMRSD